MSRHIERIHSLPLRLVGVLLVGLPGVLSAHATVGVAGGLMSGFFHPITGLDHVAAMVAVGIWGAQRGGMHSWLLPIAFLVVMIAGAVLSGSDLLMGGVETGTAASVVALGSMVAGAARPPIWGSLMVVSVFALLHGYAHGLALPTPAAPIAFGIGFVAATSYLLVAGVGFGMLVHWPTGRVVVRLSGAAIALLGVWFLFTRPAA